MPPQHLLILYSHARTPPLNPPPDLKYDLRNIPNPPKALRAVSDGRSKRLREHLLSDPTFVAKLNEGEREIREAMRRKLDKYENSTSTVADSGEGDRGEREEEEEEGEENKTDEKSRQAAEGDEDDEDTEDRENEDVENKDEENDESILLRVGCNCALGHHRSVAFVCELASRDWPKDWLVQVEHRDLEKKRSGNAREKQKASWRKEARRGQGQMLE